MTVQAPMSPAYRGYALTIMSAVFMLNLVDRGLIHLLLQPIKEDLQLSDTQLGMVTGIAFALFYATVGVPLARWADRGNRVTITALAIGMWGLTVMSCLLISNYIQLVFARIAAAIGEAGCKPPTYSLVGDYFPDPSQRTRAMAVYWLGGPLAALLSYIVGGWLNEHYGWRLTFFLMGIPGLVLAVVVKLTIKEPRQVRGVPVPSRALPPMRAVFAALWRQQSCRHLTIALTLLYTLAFGLSPWYAAFMIRSHGMGTAELGLWLGLIFGFGGMAGVALGGYVASRWFAGNEEGQMRASALAIAAVLPCILAFLTLPEKQQALFALLPLITVFSFFYAPTYALLQRLVTDDMWATALSLVLLLTNLIGMGIGPQIVGILSDLFRGTAGADSLKYAMMAMSLVALWSAYHFWRAGRTVREDLARVPTGRA